MIRIMSFKQWSENTPKGKGCPRGGACYRDINQNACVECYEVYVKAKM